MFCDFAFYVGGTRENVDESRRWSGCQASAGVKVFMGSSTGDLLVDDEPTLDRVIAPISPPGRPFRGRGAAEGAHAGLRRPGDPSTHPVWRDEEAAMTATQRLVRLAERHGSASTCCTCRRRTRCRSSAAHKDMASGRSTPQHLTLAAPECYERLGTYAQMNPPIRDERHRAGAVAALASGRGRRARSDHAPHTREEKATPIPTAIGHDGRADAGAHHARPCECRPADAAALRRSDQRRAARMFGIAGKGRIAVGYDADFTVVDLKGADDHQELDPVALRLDAVRRHGRTGLASGHDRTRPARDVGRRDCGAGPRRAGQVLPRTSGRLAVLCSMKDRHDDKLIKTFVDSIDDDVGEPAHDPFARSRRLTAAPQARKDAEALYSVENAPNHRSRCARIFWAIQSCIRSRSPNAASRTMTFMKPGA